MKIKRACIIWFAAIWAALAGPTLPAVKSAETVSDPAPKTAPRFSPEERARRKQLIKERLARQISELRKKRANGELGDEDRKRLARLEQLAARLHREDSNAPAGGVMASPGKPVTKAK